MSIPCTCTCRSVVRPARCKRHLCQATGDSLVSWVRSNGGKVWEGVEVTSTNTTGLGLKITQACVPGQELIRLPKSCQLTYGAGRASPALSAVIEKIPPSFWGLRLAMKVLEERAMTDSKFLPYIQALPAVIQGLPMFFAPDAVKELWYPPLVSEVSKRGRFMYQLHQEVITPLRGTAQDPFGGVDVDLSGVGWALGVVTSRAFATDGPGKPRSLLPLIDIANHSFANKNCDIDKRQGGSIVLVATKAIPAGSELLLSYGALDNHTLLLDYGFMDPDNPFDHMVLSFDIEQLLALDNTTCYVSAAIHACFHKCDPQVMLDYCVDMLRSSSEGYLTHMGCLKRNEECMVQTSHVFHAMQAIVEAATGKQQSLTGWQKQLLLQARLVGDNADKGITVGRGSATSGELPLGVDPRLIMAARVLCSSSAEAARSPGKKSTPPKESTAAALVLIHQYLQMLFSGLGLDAIREQGRMAQPGLPADFKTAAQLRMYKALLCEEVLSKVQVAATNACKDIGIDGDRADLTLKDLLDAAVPE